MNLAYEIQTNLNGVWQIDAVFDEEDLAIFEAQMLHEGGKYRGVRVVLESYDPDTHIKSVRTVLKLEKPERRSKKTIRGSRKRKPKSNNFWMGIGLRVIVLVFLGAGLLIGFRYAFNYI